MIDIFKTYEIPSGSSGHLRIGPLSLWMANFPDEWQIRWSHSGDPIHDGVQDLEIRALETEFFESQLLRFGFNDKSDQLDISPRLSDRSIVVRPDKPLMVPGGEKVDFVLSTPLWLSIADARRGCFLTEIPSHRPSDTWFGESPVEGELCYLTRTSARLRLEDLPVRHHRAVTMISINNRHQQPLLVDRVKIPMRNLSLYRSDSGWFYSDRLGFDWEGKKDEIRMSLQGKPEWSTHRLVLAAGPREPLESNLVIRTVKSLFGSLSQQGTS